MHPSQITAVMVTKGGYDIDEVIDSLDGFGEVLVHDNSLGEDFKVYGRYESAHKAAFPVIYVQDDDCIIDAAAICAEYEPRVITLNWPEAHRSVNECIYKGCAPVGWGAVFDSGLMEAFDRYYRHFRINDLFYRECDRVFTALNPWKAIEVRKRDLDRANDASRMWRESRHLEDFAEIRRRLSLLSLSAATVK